MKTFFLTLLSLFTLRFQWLPIFRGGSSLEQGRIQEAAAF